MKKIISKYPLTLPGTCAFITVFAVLVKGYTDSDYQTVFIAIVFFVLFLIILSVSVFFAGKTRLYNLDIRSQGCITSSEKDENTQSIIFEFPPPVFFRYSAVIRGSLNVYNKKLKYFNKSNSNKEGCISFSYFFNIPGLLESVIEFYIEDIFGLVSVRCSDTRKNSVKIVPGTPENAFKSSSDSMSSFIKNKKPAGNDYEKIFMREYMSGDRFRDINWKASSKSNTVYTRIAPDNDDKIKKINFVYCGFSELFTDNIYRGFLVVKYFREYFRFFVNNLFSMEDYKLKFFVNGNILSAEDRSSLENIYAELSCPVIKNDFEQTVKEEEGSFIVFCEDKKQIEKFKNLFSNASDTRFFYPETLTYLQIKENNISNTGYGIDLCSFEDPGKGVFSGQGFYKSMRSYFKQLRSREDIYNNKNSRAVKIISRITRQR